jgi:hypothetical protein
VFTGSGVTLLGTTTAAGKVTAAVSNSSVLPGERERERENKNKNKNKNKEEVTVSCRHPVLVTEN